MTDNQRSKSQQNLSSASPQRKLGFSLWVPERAQRENLAPQDNPRFKSEKTHHLLHQSHYEIPGGEKKTLGEDLAPQNNNPRFKSAQHSTSASPQWEIPEENPACSSGQPKIQIRQKFIICVITVENS
jgi:hypothetical protein